MTRKNDPAQIATGPADIIGRLQEQQVVELTITSLHALAVKSGAASSKYVAATKATLKTVAVALQQAGTEDVILQV